MKQSLRSRLVAYLFKQHGWVSSGDLQRLVMQYTTYTPQNVGRRLRELQEDGQLEVKYINNHAYYKIRDGISPPKQEIIIKGVGHLPSYSELEKAGVV